MYLRPNKWELFLLLKLLWQMTTGTSATLTESLILSLLVKAQGAWDSRCCLPQSVVYLMTVLLGGLQGCTLSVAVLPPAPCSYLPIPVVLGSLSCTLAVLKLLFQALHILAFPMYLLNFMCLWNWTCKKWFPYFLVRFGVTYNE